MDKDMPAIKYLDIAAEAMGMPCWRYLNAIACDYRDELRDGAIAHARTLEALAKYEPEPVDPDLVTAREICAKVARVMSLPDLLMMPRRTMTRWLVMT